mmetsp:Transcript_25650/g.84119  ORF Transcript_25650/g.84119 Transcript_25650/m.84119 type:complete len:302 (-) Transcript_25650:1912-2817(-)
MDASAEDFTHAVRVIVQHFGGDVNDVQGDGETLLHKAAAAGNTSMGAALLAAGSVDRAEGGGGNFALHRAADGGHVEIARLLVNAGGDVNVRDVHDNTPLHLAAYDGHAELVRFLLSAGANVHCVDDSGDTPLHDAARTKHGAEAVRLLLDAGCKVDVKDEDGSEPLHIAAENGADATIRCLLTFGADVNSVGGSLGTPISAALEHSGERRTLAVLLEAGATIDMEELSLIPRSTRRADSWRYLDKVVAAGGYERLVRTYRRVLTAPRGCLTRYLRRRFGRDAPHDVAARVLEYWKPPGGP